MLWAVTNLYTVGGSGAAAASSGGSGGAIAMVFDTLSPSTLLSHSSQE